MSVEDVCELGSLLQSGDEEKSLLERKLIELDGAIQTQDRRLSHEVEAELWARTEQKNLLDRAINTGNNFEIASSVISQLKEDTILTQNLSGLTDRVNSYIILKNDLVDDISSVQREIDRLQEAFNKIHQSRGNDTSSKIVATNNLVTERTNAEGKLKSIITDINADIEERKAQIDKKLASDALDIQNSFPLLERKQQLAEEKRNALAEKMSADRVSADAELTTLLTNRTRSAAVIDEIVPRRNSMRLQSLKLAEKSAVMNSSLLVSRDQNAVLITNSIASSEAEHSTAKEVEDSKRLLADLEKLFAEDNNELDRIRRALAFETAREEAFLKSQSGNSLNAQQISGEAERLRQSLELVRQEISEIKNQISFEPCSSSENPEVLEYTPDDRLVRLHSAVSGHKTRKSIALAAHATRIQEAGMLNERRSVDEAKRESALKEREALRTTVQSLLAEQEVVVENLRILKERSDAFSPPSDMHELSASLTRRALEQKDMLKAAEEDEADAVKCFAGVSSSLTKHAGHIKAYNMMKKTQFEVTNKDRRLRASRQEKLVESSRILKALQDELVMEDNKFKEAVKAAEDNARRTEEKVVAEMNKVIEIGVQLISQRNGRRKEIEILEDSLKNLDDIYELELSILGNVKVAEPPTQTIASRKRRDQKPDHSSSRTESSRQDKAQRKNSHGKSSKMAHSPNRHSPSACDDTWGSSSPATFLPESPQEAGSGDEGSIEGERTEKAGRPAQTMDDDRVLQSSKSKKASGQTRELTFTAIDAIAVVADPVGSSTNDDRKTLQASRLEKDKDDRQVQRAGAKMRVTAPPARSLDKPSDIGNGVDAQKEPSAIKRKHRQSVAGSKRSRS